MIMFKFTSRLLGVLIAFVVFASTVLPGISHAEEGTDVIAVPQVITDNAVERVVLTTENGIVTKATFNKELNTLIIEEEGKDEVALNIGELSEAYIQTGAIETKSKGLFEQPVSRGISISPPVVPGVEVMATSTTSQNTFINYEYTITHSSPEKWQLRRPNGDSLVKYYYKDTTRTSSNASNLASFQSAVENINYLELRAIGGSLTTLGLAWLAFILSVPTAGSGTLTAGLAALGAYGATLDTLVKLHRQANLASTYYHRA